MFDGPMDPLEVDAGGYKEMSSFFADQQRPRIRVPMRGGWAGDCRVSANNYMAIVIFIFLHIVLLGQFMLTNLFNHLVIIIELSVC
jgi:hypothetical protein